MHPKVLSFDPGGTTGVVAIAPEFESPEFFQLGPHKHQLQMLQLLDDFDPGIVIYEKFHHRAAIQKDSATEPVKYISVLELYAQMRMEKHRPIVFYPQEASQAKHFWTDDKIRQIGLWQPGMRHAMDALKHYLHWITFNQKDNSYVSLLRP